MKDIIDHNFAAIWLTAAEFAGPLCRPPELADNPLLRSQSAATLARERRARARRSMSMPGAVSASTNWRRPTGTACSAASPKPDTTPTASRWRRAKMIPMSASRRAIICCTRASSATSDRAYGEDGTARGLERLHGRNHLGGTMFPNQWTPKHSATYLEIEEAFRRLQLWRRQRSARSCEHGVRLGLRLKCVRIHRAFIQETTAQGTAKSTGTSRIFLRCRRGQC